MTDENAGKSSSQPVQVWLDVGRYRSITLTRMSPRASQMRMPWFLLGSCKGGLGIPVSRSLIMIALPEIQELILSNTHKHHQT
jgi:hypothetical protein